MENHASNPQNTVLGMVSPKQCFILNDDVDGVGPEELFMKVSEEGNPMIDGSYAISAVSMNTGRLYSISPNICVRVEADS